MGAAGQRQCRCRVSPGECAWHRLILWTDCGHCCSPVGSVSVQSFRKSELKLKQVWGSSFSALLFVPRTSVCSGSEMNRELLVHGAFAALTRLQLHSSFTRGRVSVISQSSAGAAVLQELGLSSDCCDLGRAASQGRTCHPFPLKSFQFPASLCTADDYLAKAFCYFSSPCVVQIILS